MPYPANIPKPDDLIDLSPREIAELPVELLAILQSEINARMKQGKEQKLSDEQLIILNKTTSEQGEFALPFELVLPLARPIPFK